LTVDNLEDGRNWASESRLRLARRRGTKPDTKAAQIRALWPEIDAALEGGQSLKSICHWLEEDAGIIVGATSLTSYISRIRKRESTAQHTHESQPRGEACGRSVAPHEQAVRMPAEGAQQLKPTPNADPIAQAMRALTKPRLDIRQLHGDGDPAGKSLI
jgi:hypothetical protein